MDIILIDGVDDGILTGPTKWDVNNSGPVSALHGLAWGLGNGTTLTKNFTPSDTIGLLRFGYSANITQEILWFYGDAGATTHLAFQHDNGTGQIVVKRGASGTTLGATPVGSAPTLTPIHLEIRAVLGDAPNGEVQIWINGALVLDLTGIDTKNGGTATKFDRLTLFQFGGYGAEGRIDDLVVWTDDGGALDHIGVRRVITTFPAAEGTTSQWTGSDGNDIDNHLLVDEAGTPNTADHVLSDVEGEVELFAMGDLGGSNFEVTAVQLLIHAAKSDSGDRSLRRVLRSGGSNHLGSDAVLGEAYVLASGEILVEDPATSATWTPAGFDALELGAEVRA